MKIQIDGNAKEIAELLKTIRQEKTVTYGDIKKHLKNQSDGVSIEQAPLVVVANTSRLAEVWH